MRCNCATENEDWYTAGDNEIRSDRGVLTNHSEIPIIQFTLQTELQFYRIYIGPLVCEQGIELEYRKNIEIYLYTLHGHVTSLYVFRIVSFIFI